MTIKIHPSSTWLVIYPKRCGSTWRCSYDRAPSCSGSPARCTSPNMVFLRTAACWCTSQSTPHSPPIWARSSRQRRRKRKLPCPTDEEGGGCYASESHGIAWRLATPASIIGIIRKSPLRHLPCKIIQRFPTLQTPTLNRENNPKPLSMPLPASTCWDQTGEKVSACNLGKTWKNWYLRSSLVKQVKWEREARDQFFIYRNGMMTGVSSQW